MTCFAIRHHDFLRDSNPLLVQSMFDNYKKVALNNLFCWHCENDAIELLCDYIYTTESRGVVWMDIWSSKAKK